MATPISWSRDYVRGSRVPLPVMTLRATAMYCITHLHRVWCIVANVPSYPIVLGPDGRSHTLQTPLDVKALQLEAVGSAVNQSLAITERNRWLQLIRNVGTGAPPHASITYSGGDVCDARNDGSNVTWVMADFFDNLTVGGDDTYNSTPIGPTRNGAITQNSGTSAFTGQLGGVGTAWLRAVENGGLPFGLWWPLTIAPSATSAVHTWVGCWYNDAAITADNPFGAFLDTHLVQTAFGTYQNHVVCGFTDQKFFIECTRLSGTTMFTLGGEFHPAIDHVITRGVAPYGYAMGGNLTAIQQQLDLTHRLSRVAQANFGTINAWEYWTGSGWSANRANAVELTDTDDRLINGSAGFAEVQPGLWVLVAHQMVDPYLDVYHASAPQGPWIRHARVPILPPVGTLLPQYHNAFQISWHAKVHTHFSTPVGFSIASLTNFPQVPNSVPFTDRGIELYAPTFVVVPWT